MRLPDRRSTCRLEPGPDLVLGPRQLELERLLRLHGESEAIDIGARQGAVAKLEVQATERTECEVDQRRDGVTARDLLQAVEPEVSGRPALEAAADNPDTDRLTSSPVKNATVRP